MKTVLRIAMNSKVHSSLFVLACLLLGAVALVATVMAWDVISVTDKALQQSQVPLGTHLHI